MKVPSATKRQKLLTPQPLHTPRATGEPTPYCLPRARARGLHHVVFRIPRRVRLGRCLPAKKRQAQGSAQNLQPPETHLATSRQTKRGSQISSGAESAQTSKTTKIRVAGSRVLPGEELVAPTPPPSSPPPRPGLQGRQRISPVALFPPLRPQL